MIAIDINQKQALDADPKAMHQTNFTGKLDRPENATILYFVFFSKSHESITNLFCFHIILI